MTTTAHDGCPLWDAPMERGTANAAFDAYSEIGNQQVLGPVLRATEGDGYYILTRHDDIVTAFQRPELYSSRRLQPGPPIPFQMIPIMLDPPEHTKWRRALGSYFTPKRAEELRPRVRAVANELIDAVAERGECDFVEAFASRLPTIIFLEFMGLPADELEKFLAWNARAMTGASPEDPTGSEQITAVLDVIEYLWQVVTNRRANPESGGDDLLSQSAHWLVDGEPPNDQDLLMCCLSIYMAGLDTVKSMLSYFFFHLATNPVDRQRISSDPTVIPAAMEEMLRAFPIIKVGREVTTDHEIGGCPVRAGEVVMLPTMAAGRDPERYPDAAKIDFDRDDVRHATFGAGPHRCIGSHLARVELAVALEEWHRRIPDYKISDVALVREKVGQAVGLETLPLVW
ncbi:cytochrome P450 [Sporichthya brevicatena]|uniref:Cytochrome P450 n=1 Tax=Sporichthya brevicatena TaxID=171442 RepID=A0ABN1G4Q2_9ACTN